MQRIAIAVVLSGLLAACGQPSQSVAEGGATAQLDYIDAVPIDEDAPAPVAQPQPAAKKDEPEQDKAAEDDAEVPPTLTAPPSPEPASKAEDAGAATRRANETAPIPYEPAPN